MPTVPTLGGQQVVPQPLGSNAMLDVHYPPDAFGAAVGRGIAEVGGAVQRIWENEQDKANASQVDAARAQSLALKTRLIQQQSAGRGTLAHEQLDDYRRQYDDAIAAIRASTIKNDAQGREFDAWQEQQRVDTNGAFDAHALQEGQQQAMDNHRAFIANNAQASLTHANDPLQVQADWQASQANAAQWGRENGYSDEQIKAEQQATAGAFWGLHIQAHLAAGNDREAQRIFDQYKSQLDAGSLLRYKAMVAVGTRAGNSQREAARVYAPSKSYEEMATEIGDNDKLDEQTGSDALERVRILMHQGEQAQQQIRKTATAKAWQVMGSDPRGIDAVTPDMWVDMGEERAALVQGAYARQAQGIAIDPVVSRSYLYQYQRLLATPEGRQTFGQLDLTAPDAHGRSPLTTMNQEDFATAMGWQRDLNERRQGSPVLDATAREQAIQWALHALGIDPQAKVGSADFAKANRLRQELDEELRGQVRQDGLPRDPEQVRKALATLIADTDVEVRRGALGAWFTGSDTTVEHKPLYEAIDELRHTVPEAKRAALVEGFTKRNRRPPTIDEELRALAGYLQVTTPKRAAPALPANLPPVQEFGQ